MPACEVNPLERSIWIKKYIKDNHIKVSLIEDDIDIENRRVFYTPDGWEDTVDVDDDFFFEKLIDLAMSTIETEDELDRFTESVKWAIDIGSDFDIEVSVEKQDEIENSYPYYAEGEELFDYSPVAKNMRLYRIIHNYGFPVRVKKEKWSGDFYFVAEGLDNYRIVGTAYKGGKKHQRQNGIPYTYARSDVFQLYKGRNTSSKYNTNSKRIANTAQKALENSSNEDLLFNNANDADTVDRKYNENILNRIKNNEKFDEVQVNNSELKPHQRAGVKLASRYNRFAFFYDTGTGKTFMTLSIIRQKQEQAGGRFLVLAPKSIIKTAWMEDACRFFPDMKLLPLSSNMTYQDYYDLYRYWHDRSLVDESFIIADQKWEFANEDIPYGSRRQKAQYYTRKEILDMMIDHADHYIVNIERYRSRDNADKYRERLRLDKNNAPGLIIDESAILKNPQSTSAKVVLKHSDEFEYIYLLSGKPAPNNRAEYYAQMRLVDPQTFSMTYNSFAGRFFYGPKLEIISKYAEEEVAKMVSNRSLTVSKDDCLHLPEIHFSSCEFMLDDESMQRYNELYEECIYKIILDKKEKKEKYSKTSGLGSLMKLREIASGFIKDTDSGVIEDIHRLKVDRLHSIIKQYDENEQILIWCQFQHEIEILRDYLSRIGSVSTAYGKTIDLDQNIEEFKSNRARFMIAHPRTIKYGATFVKCRVAVYYSMSYSAEEYYQSRDRIYRLGQERECDYHFIIANDTIDEVMYSAVKNKMSAAEVFNELVKKHQKYGVEFEKYEAHTDRRGFEIGMLIQKGLFFSVIDDCLFEYRMPGKKQPNTAPLYNTMLWHKKEEELLPEEIILEIYIAEEMYQDRGEYQIEDLTYHVIKKAANRTIFFLNNIKYKVSLSYDYLEEQIRKQYEIDLANGLEEVGDEAELLVRTL